MDIVKLAEIVATFMHCIQTYGDGKPYEHHLKEVVDTLIEFGITNPILLAVAWLHDLLEDTPATYALVATFFGDKIADLVLAVTSERGRNRKERNVKTYYKLLEFPEAIPVKLADRISNVRNAIKNAHNTRFYDMYKTEYESFREILYKEGEYAEMWSTLDILLKFEPNIN